VIRTVVCMLICTMASGDMDGFLCQYAHWYMVVWTVVCMSICTLAFGGMDGCMYVNIDIGIWWYGRCMYINMYIGIW